MQVETKFLRLCQPAALGEQIDGWKVYWVGGWGRDQPAKVALQLEGLPDMSNTLELEGCILPVSSALSVQNLCNLPITVLVQEPVDLDDDLRFCFPYLGNWQ